MRFMIRDLIIGVALISSACSTDTINSDDVNEVKIYRVYNVAYDHGQKSEHINAQFRVGGRTGTTVRLSDPSAIQVCGARLSLQDATNSISRSIFTGTFYSIDKTVEKPDSAFLFSWTKRNGEKFEDSATLPGPANATSIANGAKIKRSRELNVTVDQFANSAGGNTSTAISIIISPVDTANSTAANTIVSSVNKGNVIHFAASELAQLPKGLATLTVKHDAFSRINSSDQSIGGSIHTSYLSAPLSIEIEN